MINVLLADDHELVRTGIRRLLEDTGRVKVIDEVASGEEAVEAARRRRPDVVLMDVNMPGIGGLEATRRLLNLDRRIRVVVLTVHADGPLPQRLLQAGASSYLTKGCNVDEMLQAIDMATEGKRYLSPDVAQNLALNMVPGGEVDSRFEQLSQREMQVMMMLLQGQKVQEIGESLHLSAKTISTYRYRIFDKLGVKTDAELTRLAIKYGLLGDDAQS